MDKQASEVKKTIAGDVSYAFSLIHPIATALLDEQLQFIQSSSDFGRMIGLQDRQLVGSLLTEILWEFVGVETYIKAILLGKSERFLLENINRQMPDGTSRFLSFQVMSNLEQAGTPTLLLIVEDRSDIGQLQQSLIQDRNELRLARSQLTKLNTELAQLNRLKSLFLSMAAHDLRTPLSSIHGYAELLRDELADDDLRRRDLFDVILSQTYRLQHLINDLLDLDQVERGQMGIIFRDCLVDEIISEVVTAMRPLAHRANIRITVDLEKEPFPITADPQRLSQIFYNLLGNALNFTPSGGHVHLLARQVDNQLHFEVRDDGLGISPIEMANLFEPYYPPGTKKRNERKTGSGLGLYIVGLLVEAHHGEIKVKSEMGKGTTFSIRIPISRPDGAQE